MKPFSHLFALLLAAALGACAMPSTIAPNTSADELLKKLGKPTETRAQSAGGEFWDYVYGPSGTETWRFGLDSGRVVRSKEQLLTYERLYKVVPGKSTEQDVRELLGKPGQISRLALGPAWEWRVNLQPNMGYFVVNFDHKGIVSSTAVLIDAASDSSDQNSP